MKLDIPNYGIIEISDDIELSSDLVFSESYLNIYATLEYNFFVTKLNGKTCLVGDRENSSAFIMELLDNDFFFSQTINYVYPDISYWFFARNEFGVINAEDANVVEAYFNFLLEKKIILKVESDELSTKGIASTNYVYVLPNYEDFDIESNKELYLEYANMALKELEFRKDIFVEQCFTEEDEEAINDEYNDYVRLFEKEIKKIQERQ